MILIWNYCRLVSTLFFPFYQIGMVIGNSDGLEQGMDTTRRVPKTSLPAANRSDDAASADSSAARVLEQLMQPTRRPSKYHATDGAAVSTKIPTTPPACSAVLAGKILARSRARRVCLAGFS